MTKTEKIYRIIKDNPGLTVADITERMESGAISFVYQVVNYLEDKGWVHHKRDHGKRYFDSLHGKKKLSDFYELCKLYDKCHAAGIGA